MKYLIAVCCTLIIFTQAVFAAGGIAIVGGMTRHFDVQPGATVEGKILVYNGSSTSKVVEATQHDYTFKADGTSSYLEPGTLERSNAMWVSFTPRQLLIEPDQSEIIYFTVRVPTHRAMNGTYWSVLRVDHASRAERIMPDPEAKGIGVNVRVVTGQVIQIVTDVGRGGSKEVNFTGARLVRQDGDLMLLVDVENVGERWLHRPEVWAELFDEKGRSVGRFMALTARTYPGCSRRYSMRLTGLPADKYSALVVVDDGAGATFGTQYNLNVK